MMRDLWTCCSTGGRPARCRGVGLTVCLLAVLGLVVAPAVHSGHQIYADAETANAAHHDPAGETPHEEPHDSASCATCHLLAQSKLLHQDRAGVQIDAPSSVGHRPADAVAVESNDPHLPAHPRAPPL